MPCQLYINSISKAYGFNFSNSYNFFKFLYSQFFPDILFKPIKAFKHH